MYQSHSEMERSSSVFHFPINKFKNAFVLVEQEVKYIQLNLAKENLMDIRLIYILEIFVQ